MPVSHSPEGSSQSGRRPSLVSRARHLLWLVFAFLAVATTIMPSPSYAAVSVRVEARPISAPINAYVTVTDAGGQSVTGLTAADFSILVDGVGIGAPSFSLPPATGSQKVSVVFAMDYSSSVQTSFRKPMEDAVIAFINAMQPGDYAAIVKFNTTNPGKASVVQPFTQIDGAASTALLINAVKTDYPGLGSNILDATLLSVQQLTSPPVALPSGPKAVVLVSDGNEYASSVDINSVVQAANAAKVSIFTVGVGDFTSAVSQQILNGLPDQTGGKFYTDTQIGQSYLQVSQLLNNEYLLSFQSSITDCGQHTLNVQVTGQAQPGTALFTRCTPLFAPDVRGQTLTEATIELNTLGLVPGRLPDKPSVTVPAGSVVSQDPTVGAVVLPGSTVNLVVSSGQPTVPDVAGKTESAAKAEITQAGLVVGTVTQGYSSTVPAGDVISVSAPYEAPTGGAAVDLVVSAGPLAGGGGGGGGATGPIELALGLLFVAVLAASRRRKV